MKAKIDQLEQLAASEPSLRMMVTAAMTGAGATSVKHLADLDPQLLDELIEDCQMIGSQLDDTDLINEMQEVAGFHFEPQEQPDVGQAE